MADLDTKKAAMRPKSISLGYGLLESGVSEDEVFERKDGDDAGLSAFWLKCACYTWNARGASVGKLQVQRPVAIDIALRGLGTNCILYQFFGRCLSPLKWRQRRGYGSVFVPYIENWVVAQFRKYEASSTQVSKHLALNEPLCRIARPTKEEWKMEGKEGDVV
jgi:hypothetical protein